MKGNEKRGIIYAFISAIFWGFVSVYVNKLNNIGLEAMDSVFIRILVALIITFLIVLLTDKKALYVKIKDLWCFIGSGLIGTTGLYYFYFLNIKISSPGVASALMYTSPIFIMIISVFVFREKITAKKILACVIMIVGCSLISGVINEIISPKGLLFGLLSGLTYGLYSIFCRIATAKGYKSSTIISYTFLFALLGTIPFTNFTKMISVLQNESFFNVLDIILLAVFVTVIPYSFYTKALFYIKPDIAGVICGVDVVVSSFVGFFFFSEKFSADKIIGIMLVILSLCVMNINLKNNKKEILKK